MTGNVIFRGPIQDQPITRSKPVATALLPGVWVEETATQLVVLTTAIAKLPFLLGAIDFKDQDIATAYTAGDTGVAFEVRPGQIYQSRVAAATYTAKQPLTIAASGYLAAATAGTIVVAFFDDTPGAKSAGALVDVVIANSYTAA